MAFQRSKYNTMPFVRICPTESETTDGCCLLYWQNIWVWESRGRRDFSHYCTKQPICEMVSSCLDSFKFFYCGSLFFSLMEDCCPPEIPHWLPWVGKWDFYVIILCSLWPSLNTGERGYSSGLTDWSWL